MIRPGRLRVARKLKQTAERRGYSPSLRLCYRIVSAAQDTGSRLSRLAALVEKESAFVHCFGHDAGGWFPGERVTRRKYRKLRRHFKESWSGANGVSYVQVTYPQFILDDPSLWRPKKNLRWGAEYIETLCRAHGYSAESLNVYNGDPTGAYGVDLAHRVAAYATSFRSLK